MHKVVKQIHRAVFNASNGRIMGSFSGMPVLELFTTGRKSGEERSTMLTAPVAESDRVVLVASDGGSDRHPAWYLNLRDNPAVRATINGSTRDFAARTASADERAELWPKVVATFKGYEGYQKKTDREIPLVILTPASPSGPAEE